MDLRLFIIVEEEFIRDVRHYASLRCLKGNCLFSILESKRSSEAFVYRTLSEVRDMEAGEKKDYMIKKVCGVENVLLHLSANGWFSS